VGLPHAVAPVTGVYQDYFLGVNIGEPISGPWSLSEVSGRDSAVIAHLTDGSSIYDIYFTHPGFDRRPGGLRMTWFTRFIPRIPDNDPADFRRAVHVLSVALERGSKGQRPWTYARFPANLPTRVYQGAFLLLLGALGWAARRSLAESRPSIASAFGFVAMLAAGLAVRFLFSPFAPLHANQHGLEELDQLVFPLESPYPGYYGRAQEALEDLLLWWLPRSARIFFGAHAVLGVLAAAGAGLLARSLTGDRIAGWVTAAFALSSPQLIRVSTSETGFIWVILLLFPSLWGLVRYARDGDRLGLLAGGAGTLVLTHLQAVTPVFLALPAAAWFMAPRGVRIRRLTGLGLLTIALGVLLVPHLHFLLTLHESRGSGLLTEALSTLPQRLIDPGNIVLNPATGPALISAAALIGFGLLLWRRRDAAALVMAVTSLLPVGFILQTCWTDMVRYQAPAAAWMTVPAGLGVGLGLSLIPRRGWKLAAAAALIALGAASMPGPWAAHLRPDVEALEYRFLDQSIADLPQHGILVKVPETDGAPGISSYLPRGLLRQHGRSYRIVEATELPALAAMNSLGDEPVFFFRGLGHSWLEFHALEVMPNVIPEERDLARAILEDTRRSLLGFRMEVFARERIVRQVSPAIGYRMDFNELPGPYVELEVLRLMREDK